MSDKRRRPYYASYTEHMLNFFVRYSNYGTCLDMINNGFFRSEVDQNNWKACEQLLSTLSPMERDIIAIMHKDYDNTEQRVAEYAYANNMSPQDVWTAEHKILKRLAVIRGLVPEGSENGAKN